MTRAGTRCLVKLRLLPTHRHPGLNVLILESHGFGPSGVVPWDLLSVKCVYQVLIDLHDLVHEGLCVP